MLATLLLVALGTSAPSQPLYGLAVAGDGDSLRIGETRVRLFGVDAPSSIRSAAEAAHGGRAARRRPTTSPSW